MGFECEYQLPAVAPGIGLVSITKYLPSLHQRWRKLTAGARLLRADRQASTQQLEGRLNSIEETLRVLLEQTRKLPSDSIHHLLPSPVDHTPHNSILVGLEADLSGMNETAAGAAEHQGQPLPDDTIDGMGTTNFADEQDSGFFGKANQEHAAHSPLFNPGRQADVSTQVHPPTPLLLAS